MWCSREKSLATSWENWSRRESERMDRALITVIDGYDVQKMMQGISWCWTASFLGHFMVLRGKSRRMAHIPDLVTIDLPNERPAPSS
jgi:hypothetical protein